MTFRVLFPNGHTGQSNMTLNGKVVVVNKYGTLIPLPYHNISSTYKSLQANTVLEMYYTSNYDGNNTPAFVIVGNPIVLSSNNYIIYADGKNLTDTIYPVGSLYWSSKSTNPSSLFGGTWVQIKDRFVLACGDTYKTVGATGGASSVTLSVSNMPSHNHSFTPSGTVSSSFTGTSTTTGDMSKNTTGEIKSDKRGVMTVASNNTNPADWKRGGNDGNASYVSGCFSIGTDRFSQYGIDNDPPWRPEHSGTMYPNARGCLHIDVSHSHNVTARGTVSSSFSGSAGTTGSNGSGSSFSILPPYVVKYCFVRTA